MARNKKMVAKYRVIEGTQPAAAPVAATQAGIPDDVVAAIAGAVAVVCGDSAVITGIQPSRRGQADGRSAWSMAGLLENTCPF